MTRASIIPLPAGLRRMLERFRRRWRWVSLQRGLLMTLGALAAAVGLAIAADRLLRLEPALRAAALGVIGAVFIAGLVRWVLWPVARRISDRDAAVRLGRHFPQMEEDLVSAVELSASPSREEGISRLLVVSILGRIANRAAAAVNPRAAVPLRPLLVAMGLFMVVAAAILAAYLAQPEAVSNALARLFQPTREVPFFSYTTLDVQPGDQVIRTGDAAEVNVNLGGRVPPTALLDGRISGGDLAVTLACADGRAAWHSEPLFSDLAFRVLAGDAVSEWHRVRVVPPPALRAKSAVLRDPPYAGSDERQVENLQGPLDIVAGTAVVLHGEPLGRGDDKGFQCEGELVAGDVRLPLRADASGLLVSPRFVPASSTEYAVNLKDGFGLTNRAPDSVFIKVRPDDVPKVSITSPGRDVILLAGERVEVAAEARDEFGVRSLVLGTRRAKRREGEAAPDAPAAAPLESSAAVAPWDRRTLKEGGIQVPLLQANATLDPAALGMEPGDVLEYRAEAADFVGEPSARRGASRIFCVIILSEAQHRDRVMAALRELQVELMRRAVEQRAEAARAGELVAAPKPVTADARSAEDRETALARRTESVALKFESLIPEMARNASIPPSVLSELERISRAVSSIASGQMAMASKSLGEAAAAPPQEQTPPLQDAQRSEAEAADRLEHLVAEAQRLQRSAVLEALAAAAERLAAQQRELKETTVTLAPKTMGYDPKDLSDDLKGALGRLASAQGLLKSGADSLAGDIQRAAETLAFTAADDAETARQAGQQLQSDKVAEKMSDLERADRENILFARLPKQDEVVKSLLEIAKTLHRSQEAQPMEAVAKELDEFIRRQKEINAEVEGVIRDPLARQVNPGAEGARQSRLAREVSEQAAALEWLAQEIEGFQSASAKQLTGASGEMREGAAGLVASRWPDGLDHGRKALALLEDARSRFQKESSAMAQAGQRRQSLQALLLLCEILAGQKQVNRDTADVDESRSRDLKAFVRRVVALASQQSGLRLKARRLEEMIAASPQAAAVVGKAGEKMDASRLALADGDTGKDTRVTQRQVVALLEQLMKEQQGASGGMGLAGMRMMAMMQMMLQPGMAPGGYAGGANAPILPSRIEKAGDEAWRKIGSRFEGNLAEGADETYPPMFRDLLNAYFDRLRRESAK